MGNSESNIRRLNSGFGSFITMPSSHPGTESIAAFSRRGSLSIITGLRGADAQQSSCAVGRYTRYQHCCRRCRRRTVTPSLKDADEDGVDDDDPAAAAAAAADDDVGDANDADVVVRGSSARAELGLLWRPSCSTGNKEEPFVYYLLMANDACSDSEHE